jgi:hypothetical protein
MKLTKESRINAIMLTKRGKDIVLYTRDKNMTLGEYISKSFVSTAVLHNESPNPIEILDFDFEVGSSSINSHGHRFTLLTYENENTACVISKLDLAGSY